MPIKSVTSDQDALTLTVVGEYPSGVVAGQGSLGRDTVLGPPHDEEKPPAMRVGVRSRIGVSTSLR